jgi:hypothetical protein
MLKGLTLLFGLGMAQPMDTLICGVPSSRERCEADILNRGSLHPKYYCITSLNISKCNLWVCKDLNVTIDKSIDRCYLKFPCEQLEGGIKAPNDGEPYYLNNAGDFIPEEFKPVGRALCARSQGPYSFFNIILIILLVIFTLAFCCCCCGLFFSDKDYCPHVGNLDPDVMCCYSFILLGHITLFIGCSASFILFLGFYDPPAEYVPGIILISVFIWSGLIMYWCVYQPYVDNCLFWFSFVMVILSTLPRFTLWTSFQDIAPFLYVLFSAICLSVRWIYPGSRGRVLFIILSLLSYNLSWIFLTEPTHTMFCILTALMSFWYMNKHESLPQTLIYFIFMLTGNTLICVIFLSLPMALNYLWRIQLLSLVLLFTMCIPSLWCKSPEPSAPPYSAINS